MNNIKVNTNKLSIEDLKALKRLEYNRWKPIKCPLMGGELVYFNKDGFFHLTHNGQGKLRTKPDQRMRLNLLSYARKVIYRSRNFSANEKVVPPQESKIGKHIHFYELTYRFSPQKAVTVVLRRLGDGGRLHYYSIRYYKKHKI
ncbi:MAG: hypothetical protein Q4E70_00330 [Candidatus Saccharibacteria bacterium]|nr:hypothetical protein [Candidatus Saccharibacteria bacterium]